MLFPRYFDNGLSVYFFLEFEPQLGKSEKFNNQGMKENKAFGIPFITKKQLKSRQALGIIFVKLQYTVSEFQFHSVNYKVVARIRKNFEQHSILNKASKGCEWYFSM